MPASPTETIHTDASTAALSCLGGKLASATRTLSDVSAAKFGLLAVELVGLACLIYRFQIESDAFLELFVLAAIGFVVNYFLPLQYRLTCFLCLSLISIWLVLGVVQGTWLVLLGLLLIGITHLPVSAAVRIALLVASGLILAMLRNAVTLAPWSSAIWPILASMFMFRLIVYVYDLNHGQAPDLWTQRLAYFFMLPNVCFQLFPVVDSRTFVRTYYDGERHDIHQRGIEWMLRGAVQLILYRLVYQRLTLAPSDITNSADLVQYSVSLFLLYLRVSGQFHLIVGMLHLFGFHLPETHHLYYFASSFTDFWRRINIYWKDFMMKVFYYPMFFRTRQLGPTLALVISTACVFMFTWLLHAYQLFWICGKYEFRWNDFLFWTILCGLVIVNALWEARVGRRRVLGKSALSWTDQAIVVVKTAVTFSLMCVLWTFWSSPSLEEWFSLWPAALIMPTASQMRVFSAVAVAGLLFLILFLLWLRWGSEWVNRRFGRRTSAVLVQLLLLNAMSISAVHSRLGDSISGLVVTARFGRLNNLDRALLERGYYEDLYAVDRFGELAALYSKRPTDWIHLNKSSLIQATDIQGLRYELRPNHKAKDKGASFRSNSWGMSDQDYTQKNLDKSYRIAMLGASHTMGSGVEREQTFEAVLERHLNAEFASEGNQKFEVLNFAVGGYYPFEQLRVIEERALLFEPDAVFYVGHPGEAGRVVQYLSQSVRRGDKFYFRFLSDIVRRADVNANTSERLAYRQLEPFAEEILVWLYREMVMTCTKNQVHPVFVRLPLLDGKPYRDSETPQEELARKAGFTVFDLDGVYDVPDQRSLWIAEWDTHPNAQAHRMVGDRLYQLVRQSGAALGLEFMHQ